MGRAKLEYYLDLWEALYSGTSLTSPDVYPSFYRDATLLDSESTVLPRICTLPIADLSLAIKAPTANQTRRGKLIAYVLKARNAGPDGANDVFLYSPVPIGTKFVKARASRGSCSAAAGGPIACRLGRVPAGTTVSVRILFRVRRSGSDAMITNRESGAAFGVRVTGPDHDPNTSNNSASFSTPVSGGTLR